MNFHASHTVMALSLATVGFSLAFAYVSWKARQNFDRLAAQITTCTTELTRVRLEADALRTVLLMVGVDVTLTWTADRVLEAAVSRRAPLARPQVGHPWTN